MIYETADIGPFEILVDDLLSEDDGVHLRIKDGECRDIVPPEEFDNYATTGAVWTRGIELFEAKIAEWRRDLMHARSLYKASPPTLDSVLDILTFDDLGAILTSAGVDMAESLPGRKEQLRSILYRNHG